MRTAFRRPRPAYGPGVERLPSYAEVRDSAAEPVVYLAAADLGGYALIVTDDRPEPVVVPLPELTRDRAEDEAERHAAWLSGSGPADLDQDAELTALLDRLWTYAMEPVVRLLPADRTPVLVPIGVLSLLPLHAAPVGRGLGPRPMSYAPNARLAEQSRRVAAALAGQPETVLAIDVPSAPGLADIPFTTEETARIQQLYGPERCDRLHRPTVAQATAALPGHGVWHFACHGRADLDDALDSALVLRDGELDVRTILAQPSAPHRLAVLSACRTDVPDRAVLDEVVSFPGALLQAGVAAVVSTQWSVHDLAAGLLVTRFHRERRDGRAPAVALAVARDWLRTVSYAELRTAEPGRFRPPEMLAAEHVPIWEQTRPFAAPSYWAAFSCTGA